jgi:hypothetical protein
MLICWEKRLTQPLVKELKDAVLLGMDAAQPLQGLPQTLHNAKQLKDAVLLEIEAGSTGATTSSATSAHSKNS